MTSRCNSGDLELKPNVVIYSCLIDAWAEAGEPEQAERILREMKSCPPDIVCYRTAMKGWAKSRKPHAAERAQGLFNELQNSKHGSKEMKPELIAYSTLITAWSRSMCHDGATRAQALFDDLISRYKSGNSELQPNVVICSALVDAWAKAGEPERAEQILRAVDAGTYVGVKPNVVPYNSVMRGWSNSRHLKAAERIQVLYDEMKRKYEAGDRNVNPDKNTFKVLLTAWSQRKPSRDGASMCLSVWNDLETRSKAGERELQALVEHYRPKILDISGTIS